MEQLIQKQFAILSSHHDKPILVDVRYLPATNRMPLIIFCHGFKGFKDWGHFNHIASQFARQGYVFAKFNFSHNGTTIDHPVDFVDLEAFGNNNISKELNDLDDVITTFMKRKEHVSEIPYERDIIFLAGHSRGGGVAMLKAAQDERVRGASTWAPVDNFEDRYSKEVIDEWKEKGVIYIENSRTNQEMPLYYQLAQDVFDNPDRLHIPEAVKNMKKPLQVIHGTNDETLDYKKSEKMKELNENLELHIIKGASHTFGGQHPWEEPELPDHTNELIDETKKFFNKLR